MGETKIEWAHYTFNPWKGCEEVSPGCAHCYAKAWANRMGRGDLWNGVRERTKTWGDPVKWNAKARETGKFIVFCASLADVFEDDPRLKPWRQDLWEMIAHTPNLFWLLLTKRPENFQAMLPWLTDVPGFTGDAEPWPNVGLGVTSENQRWWDERVPILVETPAAMKFVSYEPALGPVQMAYCESCEGLDSVEAVDDPHDEGEQVYLCDECRSNTQRTGELDLNYLSPPISDWVICGGESGAKARPMHPGWARSMRDQCQDAGVAFHFKQWGEWDCRSRRVGKHNAGRLLLGREWNEYPPQIHEHARRLGVSL